ncbi:hypothetical protein C8F01DRAFT_1092701 [Mycena amicta]|nr:hypothetical protein C8F01DRAFT_1092701 [Mycena amicta]
MSQAAQPACDTGLQPAPDPTSTTGAESGGDTITPKEPIREEELNLIDAVKIQQSTKTTPSFSSGGGLGSRRGSLCILRHEIHVPAGQRVQQRDIIDDHIVDNFVFLRGDVEKRIIGSGERRPAAVLLENNEIALPKQRRDGAIWAEGSGPGQIRIFVRAVEEDDQRLARDDFVVALETFVAEGGMCVEDGDVNPRVGAGLPVEILHIGVLGSVVGPAVLGDSDGGRQRGIVRHRLRRRRCTLENGSMTGHRKQRRLTRPTRTAKTSIGVGVDIGGQLKGRRGKKSKCAIWTLRLTNIFLLILYRS